MQSPAMNPLILRGFPVASYLWRCAVQATAAACVMFPAGGDVQFVFESPFIPVEQRPVRVARGCRDVTDAGEGCRGPLPKGDPAVARERVEDDFDSPPGHLAPWMSRTPVS